MKRRLAVVCTHPIQYYAPVFRFLAALPDLDLKVFYTWSQAATGVQFDREFGRSLHWDLPLLDGYDSEFVENQSSDPGTHHFWGLRTPGLVDSILRWNADAVLIYTWNSYSHLSAMRELKGKRPVFFRGDSTLLDPLPPWRRLLRRIALTWIYRHVDTAIAVGQNNRDYFIEYGIDPADICLAPHAVDNDRFDDPDGAHHLKSSQIRRQLGIPEGARTLVFAGKLIAKKSPALLVEAFLKCSADWHLIIVGDGALRPSLEARANGVSTIHFMDFQNQSLMPAVYRLGDVFILPSEGPGETWGLAINEAMASGRPVIAGSKVGAARDLITAGVNGWIFESGDLDALVNVLGPLMQLDRTTLEQMGP